MMKKIILILTILTLAFGLFAQEPIQPSDKKEFRTILGNAEEIGGYGAFGVEYGQIDELNAIFFNGKAALILGHNLAMGIAGKGFVTDYYQLSSLESYNLAGGYGGLFLEPIIFPHYPVHISVPLFFGVGGIALLENVPSQDSDEDHDNVVTTEVFLLFEPGLELQINVTHFFRIALGGYYRIPSMLDMNTTGSYPSVGSSAMEGFSGGITFKFGKF